MPKERPRCHPRRCPRGAHPACPPNVASLPAFEPAGGEEASVAEGQCISNSLLTLGAAITALTHAHGGGGGHAHTHVPFGDSVLTPRHSPVQVIPPASDRVRDGGDIGPLDQLAGLGSVDRGAGCGPVQRLLEKGKGGGQK